MAKGARIKVRMISTGTKQDGEKTGYFKTTAKNPKTTTGKLKKKYYDPRAWNKETGKVGMHVVFEEGKIK